MNANLFGTDGIRGVAGEFPLDENTLVKLGRVIGSQAAAAGIAIGRDTRASGATIEDHLARGLGKQARLYLLRSDPHTGLGLPDAQARFALRHHDFGIAQSIP